MDVGGWRVIVFHNDCVLECLVMRRQVREEATIEYECESVTSLGAVPLSKV